MKESLALEQDQSSEESDGGGVSAGTAAAGVESVGLGSEATTESLEVSSEEMAIAPYGEEEDGEEDAVTLQMDAPLDDGEWMVQTSANGHRRVSSAELAAERDLGALPATTRVWRNGMSSWTPLGEVEDLTAGAPRPIVPAPLPPPPASSRKVVPPLASPPLPSPPPPRIPPVSSAPLSPAPLSSAPLSSAPSSRPSPSSPSAALGPATLSSTALSSPSALGRTSGSSPVASRALGLSPPPPRLESRSADSEPLPAFDEPPPARRVDTATSVALDLGPEAPRRRSPWRGLVAQGAAAVVALGATSYGLIHAGVFEQPAAGANATSTLALQPGAATPAAVAPSEEPPSGMLMPKMSPPAEEPPSGMLMPKMSPPEETSPPSEMLMPKMSPPAEAPPADPAADAPATASAEPSSESDGAGASEEPAAKATSAKRSSKSSAAAAERRAKWLEKRAAAAEARKQRRATASAAAATARAVPESAEPPAEPQEPASTFDRQAAQTALAAAAELVKNCRPIGGPSGAGAVQVQYEPTGKVSSVTIVTPGFENSEAASCIQMLFRRAKVPSFNGAKGATVRQRFEIP